jgi:hypothetical protein
VATVILVLMVSTKKEPDPEGIVLTF